MYSCRRLLIVLAINCGRFLPELESQYDGVSHPNVAVLLDTKTFRALTTIYLGSISLAAEINHSLRNIGVRRRWRANHFPSSCRPSAWRHERLFSSKTHQMIFCSLITLLCFTRPPVHTYSPPVIHNAPGLKDSVTAHLKSFHALSFQVLQIYFF